MNSNKLNSIRFFICLNFLFPKPLTTGVVSLTTETILQGQNGNTKMTDHHLDWKHNFDAGIGPRNYYAQTFVAQNHCWKLWASKIFTLNLNGPKCKFFRPFHPEIQPRDSQLWSQVDNPCSENHILYHMIVPSV